MQTTGMPNVKKPEETIAIAGFGYKIACQIVALPQVRGKCVIVNLVEPKIQEANVRWQWLLSGNPSLPFNLP